MLLRLIVFFLIAYLLWRGLRAWLRNGRMQPPRQGESDGEEMVFDPQCRSYLPKTEAVQSGGRFFCSEECARLYLTR